MHRAQGRELGGGDGELPLGGGAFAQRDWSDATHGPFISAFYPIPEFLVTTRRGC